MNRTHRLLSMGILTAFVLATQVMAAEEVGYAFDRTKSVEGVRVAGEYHMPAEDDFWDDAYGVDIQFRYWFGHIGFALVLGINQWNVNDGAPIDFVDNYTLVRPLNIVEVEEIELEDVQFSGAIEGDALMVPFGASLLLRPGLNERVNLTLEAGFRVVFSDSDITGEAVGAGVFVDTVTVSTGEGSETKEVITPAIVGEDEDIELDQGVLLLAAADLEISITDDLKFFAGGGYKYDLHAMEATWGDDGPEVGEAGLEGLYGRAGLQFNY